MNQALRHTAPPADTTAGEETPPHMLFNDVHSQRCEHPAADDAAWALFPRLPAELRLHVWILYLRRYRMIELEIFAAADEEVDSYPGHASQPPRYYINRNRLGNIVSGRGYELSGRGNGAYPACLSPLLWVNTEARQAALSFYSVHLPVPGPNDETRFIYLNPVYDIVSIQPQDARSGRTTPGPRPNSATLVADFLHDIKAYDKKAHGIAHLALRQEFFGFFPFHRVQLTPSDLHPAAAASFIDILHHRLRSVLCIVGFRARRRGLDEYPHSRGYMYHFAQNFPLARPRTIADGTLHWLETDPRPGVQVDLRQIPLALDPRALAGAWEGFEQAFGITAEKKAARRFYICPAVDWQRDSKQQGMLPDTNAATQPQEGEEQTGPRAELARFLRKEDEDWLAAREWLTKVHSARSRSPAPLMPRNGWLMDAKMFARMERLPCTAVGMWLFPPEAFKKPTNPRRNCFNLSRIRPGLMLFDV